MGKIQDLAWRCHEVQQLSSHIPFIVQKVEEKQLWSNAKEYCLLNHLFATTNFFYLLLYLVSQSNT